MQCYTIFFITVNALRVSGGFSAHHQELKTVQTAIGICQACLLLPPAVAASNINCDWTVVIAVIYDYCVCITREVIAVYTYPHAFSYDGGYQLSKAWLHLLTTPNPCVHERPLNNSSVASVNATHYSLLLRGNIVTFLDKFHCVYLIHMNKSNSHSI